MMQIIDVLEIAFLQPNFLYLELLVTRADNYDSFE